MKKVALVGLVTLAACNPVPNEEPAPAPAPTVQEAAPAPAPVSEPAPAPNHILEVVDRNAEEGFEIFRDRQTGCHYIGYYMPRMGAGGVIPRNTMLENGTIVQFCGQIRLPPLQEQNGEGPEN